MRFSDAGVLRTAARLAAVCALAAVTGCATTGAAGGPQAANPKDPLEPFNRKMFAFNDALDTYALKPVATAYVNVVPSPLRTGVHNFFGNFSDAWSAVNQLLQGKPDDSARMTMRVLTNTIIGIGGLFDPATPLGLERKSEDLGQTFGRWGAPPGPYLVLPLFGPSDVRDAIALPADTYVAPALLVDTTWQKIGVDAVGVIDARANLLGASQMLDDIALDRYSFLRDAYVSRRRSLVYDGNPPDDPRSRDDDDVGPTPPSAPAPSAPASGAQTSQADGARTTVAAGGAPVAQLPPSAPSAPSPSPVPGGVTPAPLPASAPPLPVPLPGPAPVPPPPASSAHG
jgi:phospholipid-binding lipoprotein MlaA